MSENRRFQLNGSCVIDHDYKKNQPTKISVHNGEKFAGECKKQCKPERI